MVQQTGSEVLAQRAQAQQAIGLAEYGVAICVGDAEVEMQAAARRSGKRLGHAAEHRAVLRGHRVRGLFEQHKAVGRSQRVVKAVVDFVLAARVFVVDLLQVKTQRHQRAAHGFQKILVAQNGADVVRGFVQVVVRVGALPLCVRRLRTLEQKELGLNAHPQLPAPGIEPGHCRFQDLARTGIERLTTGKTIAHRMRHAGHVGQGPQTLGLYPAVVLAARTHARQASAPDAGTGKARALLDPFAQIAHRNQLALGHAMDVAKLRQDGMQALGLEGGNAFLVCHQRVKTTTSLPPHQTHTGSPLPSGTLVWRAALVCVTLRTRPEASRTW